MEIIIVVYEHLMAIRGMGWGGLENFLLYEPELRLLQSQSNVTQVQFIHILSLSTPSKSWLTAPDLHRCGGAIFRLTIAKTTFQH